MALFRMYMTIEADDGKIHRLKVDVKSRSDSNLKTVMLKGLEKVVDMYFADPNEAMDAVKALHKEAFEWDDFAEDILQELEIGIEEPHLIE